MQDRLIEHVASCTPCNGTIEYDLHLALLHYIKLFQKANPECDLSLPDAGPLVTTYLHKLFTPTEQGTGIIQLGTIHWAKGLEADVVLARGSYASCPVNFSPST